MLEDKQRWNIRHVEKPMRKNVKPILEKYIKNAKAEYPNIVFRIPTKMNFRNLLFFIFKLLTKKFNIKFTITITF